MHGRLKVRTTEEQKQLKHKEQQKKLESYRKGLKLILATRHEVPYNATSFAICSQLLVVNPDIYTLWNYRKEVTLQEIEESSKVTLEKETVAESAIGDQPEENITNEDESEIAKGNEAMVDKPNEDKPKDRLITFLETELKLTEQCLLANPKSYGSWHHRYWILERHPEPKWNTEFTLCTKYLTMDDRNFHCWDYRRLILSKIGIDFENELKFSTERINVNFSNYSSWHYRSTIRILDEESLHDEIKLVQNAVFTDPADSSAWFYLRWVLSHPNVTDDLKKNLFRDFEQLQELEPDWVYMAKCWLTGSLSLGDADYLNDRIECYEKLNNLDPLRNGQYQHYLKTAKDLLQK